MLVAKVSGVVMCPRPGIRAGVVNPDELKKFPPTLKRLVTAEGVILLSMALACVLVMLN